jgi:hypothetical protein
MWNNDLEDSAGISISHTEFTAQILSSLLHTRDPDSQPIGPKLGDFCIYALTIIIHYENQFMRSLYYRY